MIRSTPSCRQQQQVKVPPASNKESPLLLIKSAVGRKQSPPLEILFLVAVIVVAIAMPHTLCAQRGHNCQARDYVLRW